MCSSDWMESPDWNRALGWTKKTPNEDVSTSSAQSNLSSRKTREGLDSRSLSDPPTHLGSTPAVLAAESMETCEATPVAVHPEPG